MPDPSSVSGFGGDECQVLVLILLLEYVPPRDLQGKSPTSDKMEDKSICVQHFWQLQFTFVASLKSCATKKDIRTGTRLHAEIRRRGLFGKSAHIASSLINMYVKCGVFTEAEQVLEDLPVRDVISWSALISGYVREGKGQDALHCFDKMQREGISPNEVTFFCILKACCSLNAIDKGMQIHNQIISLGFLQDHIMLGTALVEMYARSGMLSKARKVLYQLPLRDVVCWNALIIQYVQSRQNNEALKCFEEMKREGILPNVITFSCILKACGSMAASDKGKQIHDEIINRDLLEQNIVLGNALVSMYAQCGQLLKAQELLEKLSVRDVASWNALISGYMKKGQGCEALDAFAMLQREGISPDVITFTCILKACGTIKCISKGKIIHDDIINRGLLKKSVALGNALIDMYARCGMLIQAQQVLDELPVRDVISWTTLIVAYTQHGQGHEALDCFRKMKTEGLAPNDVTFVFILKACYSVGAVDECIQIHDEIVHSGLLKKSTVLGNTLVDVYAKFGEVSKAQRILESIPSRNVVSWNALISGYALHGHGNEALNCLVHMQNEGISPNEVTFSCILKVFGDAEALDKGKKIHDEIVDRGLLEKSIHLGNALVGMYAKSGALRKAQEVLENLPVRDQISWSTLIAGYVQQEQCHEALCCFERMQGEGFCPDWITLIYILKACGKEGAIDKGKQIHQEISNRGGLEKNIMLGNALVDMYAKCGALKVAKQVLEDLPVRDVVSWNSLIAAYAQCEQGHEALMSFAQMQREGLAPTDVTFLCILKACSSIGAIQKGEEIHDVLVNGGFLQRSIALGTALVDMYAKSGMILKAEEVLNELPLRDVFCWSALITGYAQEGRGQEALNCFKGMEKDGLLPDAIAFLSALNACSHSGKLHDLQSYLGIMNSQYGLSPKLEHHICMVVVLGCAGNFNKAMSLIKAMPSSNDPKVWLALLGTCKKWANVKLGRMVFDEVLRIDDSLTAAYVLMSSIYAAAGMQDDVQKVEAMRVKAGLRI